VLADNVVVPVVATGVLRTVEAAIPRSINAGILMNTSAQRLDALFFFVNVGARTPCRSYRIDGAIGTIISLNTIEKSSICGGESGFYILGRSFVSPRNCILFVKIPQIKYNFYNICDIICNVD
jgi:hypothetical protein